MTPEPDVPLPVAAPSADADDARLRDDLILHQQALDGSINAIALSDLSGTLTYVNRAFVQMWRYVSTAEVLGRHASEFWDSAAAADEVIRALHAGEPGWVGELTGIRADGSSFTAELAASMVRDARGEPAGMMGSFLDATERVHAQRRLAALTRLYAVLSQVNAAIVRARDEQSLLQAICDIAVTAGSFRMAWIGMLEPGTDEVRPVARAGHEVGYLALKFKADPSALVGVGPTGAALRSGALITCSDIATDERMVAWRLEALARGYRSSAAVPLRRGRATVGVLNLYAPQVGFFTEEEQHLLREIGADISFALDTFAADAAHKAAEVEHARLVERLQQAEKMESIGRLAGGVAHDFNNMLGVIIGHTEFAMAQLPVGSPARDDLAEVNAAAQRSVELTRQLLAFARKQTITPRPLDLNGAVASSLKLLGRLIGEDVELAWRPADALWTVRADPTQIDQVLTNLCANARDAMARAGRIEVRTANVVVDAAMAGAHADVTPGEFVSVAVQDTGCGMDAQTVAHIFEPFFTTKAEGEGTGLGLSTVYGVAHQNGGFVTVDSVVGTGTTITVFLPRDYGRAAGGDGDGAAPIGGVETVLLVEDEPVVLDVTTRMLEGLGYTVLATTQPLEAADLMRRAEGAVCLALLDVVMPKLTGVELAARLREIDAALPCLFMSAYPSDIVNNRGLLETGMHFLQKPFTSHELAARVRASMGGAPRS